MSVQYIIFAFTWKTLDSSQRPLVCYILPCVNLIRASENIYISDTRRVISTQKPIKKIKIHIHQNFYYNISYLHMLHVELETTTSNCILLLFAGCFSFYIFYPVKKKKKNIKIIFSLIVKKYIKITFPFLFVYHYKYKFV